MLNLQYMSPFHSAYFNTVPAEDFDFLQYLAWQVTPHFVRSLATNQKDVSKRFKTSTSWCHLAARAVATAFADRGLTFVDGTVADVVFIDSDWKLYTTTHSWCKTKNGSILDVAPVGVLSFSPLLFSKSSNVINTRHGYVEQKYLENSWVGAEIRKMIHEPRFKKAFPVYVSLLESARRKADELIIKGSKT